MRVGAVGEISEQVRGVSYAKSDASEVPRNGYSPILRANNIGEHGLILEDFVFVPDAKISPKQRIAPNDVIVAASSGSISVVGKTAQAREGFEGAFGAFCKVLRPSRLVDPHYFGHYFRTPAYRQIVSRLAAGANINNLKNAHLNNLQIPLPSLAEQKRIAGILDAADALRGKRRESLAQLDTLLQSIFLDMFGDPVTNPMGWEQQSIDSVFDVARGGSPRPIQAYLTDSEDGLNWIMIGDASEDSRYITSTKKRIKPEGLNKSRMVHYGDFLLTNSMSFGRPYILKTEGCIHDGWLVLSPKDKRMSADFFYSLLSTEALYREFSRRAAGAVVKNLNTKLVKQVPVPVPPLDLQRRFAGIVESVEQQKTRQRAHLAELDTLFSSLQQRAFNGELSA